MEKVIAVVKFEPSIAMKALMDEVDRLNKARLKDSVAHEDAMRVLINILKARLDIIHNLQGASNIWKQLYFKMFRKNKILESKIRHDDRTFAMKL